MIRTKSEDAVSPVIGVMLILVVTIVIAAVVATFASGIGMDNEPAPTTVLDVTRFTDEFQVKLKYNLDESVIGEPEVGYYIYRDETDNKECYFQITNPGNLKEGDPDSNLVEGVDYFTVEGSFDPTTMTVTNMYYLLEDGETRDSLTFCKNKGGINPFGGNKEYKEKAFIVSSKSDPTPAGQKLTLSCLYGDPLDLSKVTISIYSSGSGNLINEVKGLTGTISPGETKVIPFKIDMKQNEFVDIVIYYGGNNKISEVENLKVIEVVHEE